MVWTTLTDWRAMAHIDDPGVACTVVAATEKDTAAPGSARDLDAAAGTVSTTKTRSFSGLASFGSENGSLTMMQGFLYGISALVIVAFLTVWTIQRTRDIAVLKALGASNAYVIRDDIAQAAIVLATGALVGGGLGLAGGFLAAQSAPFLISAGTTLIPVAGIVVLGLAGSVLAVRRATTIDPLLALGGN